MLETYEPACSPHLAARLAGRPLTVSGLREKLERKAPDGTFLLIEGAGGIYVPLNDRETMLDFMREIDFPVLLVVGNKLGCINHALLSLDVLQSHGLRVYGMILNRPIPETVCDPGSGPNPDVGNERRLLRDNAETLARMGRERGVPVLAEIPYQTGFATNAENTWSSLAALVGPAVEALRPLFADCLSNGTRPGNDASYSASPSSSREYVQTSLSPSFSHECGQTGAVPTTTDSAEPSSYGCGQIPPASSCSNRESSRVASPPVESLGKGGARGGKPFFRKVSLPASFFSRQGYPMRKSAEFTMENDKGTLSVRLQELTVREVLDMCEQFGKGPLVHDLERLLPRMSNLTTNDLMDMTPGELEMLWEQVKEVNAAFFRIAGALGFGRVLEAFRAQLRSDLMEAALNGNSSVR